MIDLLLLKGSGPPTWEQFKLFHKAMLEEGFLKINKYVREGRETGYYFPFDILDEKGRVVKRRKVKVWTTAMEYSCTFKDTRKDAGRVLDVDVLLENDVEKEERVEYIAQYFSRTGNFFYRLFRHALAQKERIMNPVFCPHDDCKKPMDIVHKGQRQYFWMCRSNDKHIEPVFEKFDLNLEKVTEDFLKIRRKQVADRKKQQKKK